MPWACYERFDRAPRFRTAGLRKRVARNLADGLHTARGSRPSKAVDSALQELKALTAEVEDRAKGGPAKRSAAAKKAAATRKRNAAKRSTAAKKAARTRAKAR